MSTVSALLISGYHGTLNLRTFQMCSRSHLTDGESFSGNTQRLRTKTSVMFGLKMSCVTLLHPDLSGSFQNLELMLSRVTKTNFKGTDTSYWWLQHLFVVVAHFQVNKMPSVTSGWVFCSGRQTCDVQWDVYTEKMCIYSGREVSWVRVDFARCYVSLRGWKNQWPKPKRCAIFRVY